MFEPLNDRIEALGALRSFITQANLVALVASDPGRFDSVERRELIQGMETALQKLRAAEIWKFLAQE